MTTQNSARILCSALAMAGVMAASTAQAQTQKPGANVKSFYDLKTETLDGKPADLASYKGKVALVVNVASKCGYTPQYEGLEKLYREMKGKGVALLGFPSNDFGGQEPGTAEEIATFCKNTYDVTFPLFSKVQTKPGEKQSPIYSYLGKASGNLPAWNFSKYVIDKNGNVVAFFPSKTTPDAPELRAALEKALAAK
ncbi:MAG: glutathione peroxidase [Vicinamibacterales bacterium]